VAAKGPVKLTGKVAKPKEEEEPTINAKEAEEKALNMAEEKLTAGLDLVDEPIRGAINEGDQKALKDFDSNQEPMV
jgi:hypothetical protein